MIMDDLRKKQFLEIQQEMALDAELDLLFEEQVNLTIKRSIGSHDPIPAFVVVTNKDASGRRQIIVIFVGNMPDGVLERRAIFSGIGQRMLLDRVSVFAVLFISACWTVFGKNSKLVDNMLAEFGSVKDMPCASEGVMVSMSTIDGRSIFTCMPVERGIDNMISRLEKNRANKIKYC